MERLVAARQRGDCVSPAAERCAAPGGGGYARRRPGPELHRAGEHLPRGVQVARDLDGHRRTRQRREGGVRQPRGASGEERGGTDGEGAVRVLQEDVERASGGVRSRSAQAHRATAAAESSAEIEGTAREASLNQRHRSCSEGKSAQVAAVQGCGCRRLRWGRIVRVTLTLALGRCYDWSLPPA